MSERRESDADAAPTAGLAILEKYEQFVDYFYPVLQNVPRKHGVARDMALTAMFQQVEMFATAGKAKQISRLYIADANLSALRFWLRFMADLARYAHSHLGLTFSRWSVAPVSRGVNFLGYRIWPNHKLLRRQSVVRAKRVISTLRARGATERLNAFVAAWVGHAKWADAHNLLRSLRLETSDDPA